MLTLTPENTGCSAQACAAAMAIMELNGMAIVRHSLENTPNPCGYFVPQFAADLARIIDREARHTAAELA